MFGLRNIENLKPDPSHAKELQDNFDSQCEQAADVLYKADVLLLVTGAGFSADSGLAVYGDVARIPAYEQLGLKYHDLCQPHWLDDDPELFYGFWGQCFNDYRQTEPHEGYGILQRWRDDVNRRRQGEVAKCLRETTVQREMIALRYRSHRDYEDAQFCSAYAVVQEEEDGQEPTPTPAPTPTTARAAGAFYASTSNVDAHLYDNFHAHEIYECHGNIELWQCTNRRYNCPESFIWRAPLDHSFYVDRETMRAPRNRPTPITVLPVDDDGKGTSPAEEASNEYYSSDNNEEETSSKPRIGHTTGVQRTRVLRNMPPSKDTKGCFHQADDGTKSNNNWPSCGHCQSLARPAILMFDDDQWLHDKAQYQRWDLWRDALFELCEERRDCDHDDAHEPLKVCVLEVGCGLNVPSCRYTSEDMVETVQKKGGQATLIRVNPDFPLVSDSDTAEYSIISIMSKGLRAIQKIDDWYSAKVPF